MSSKLLVTDIYAKNIDYNAVIDSYVVSNYYNKSMYYIFFCNTVPVLFVTFKPQIFR